MKRILFVLSIFALLFFCGSVGAQTIKKYYISHVVADGVIYYLFTQDLFGHDQYGDLSSDITYKTNGDAGATFNFTYHAPEVMKADSIQLLGDGCKVSASVAPIFIERGRKSWEHRYTCNIALTDLEQFFALDSDAQVLVWSAGVAMPYVVKRSIWKKYAPAAVMIFRTIRLNEQQKQG